MDRRCAEGFGESEPLGQNVDCDHLLSPELTGADDREQAYGTTTDHGVGAAGRDVRHLGAVEAGRENISEKQCRLGIHTVRHTFRNFERGRIREGNANVLRLCAGKSVAVFDPAIELPPCAPTRQALLAVKTRAAIRRERRHADVAALQLRDVGAELHDLTEELVAHGRSQVVSCLPAEVDVQIRSTNCSEPGSHDDVARHFDCGIRNRLHRNAPRALERNRFHGASMSISAASHRSDKWISPSSFGWTPS